MFEDLSLTMASRAVIMIFLSSSENCQATFLPSILSGADPSAVPPIDPMFRQQPYPCR